jgi:hypothetical protein
VAAVVGEFDAALVEIRVEGLQLLVVELELLRELGEGREVEAALLLAALEEGRELLLSHSRSLPGRVRIETNQRG